MIILLAVLINRYCYNTQNKTLPKVPELINNHSPDDLKKFLINDIALWNHTLKKVP